MLPRIVTPDGLFVHLSGAWEGRAADWGIWKDSGISEILQEYSKNTHGQRDAGYGLEDVIMSSYRAGRGTDLGADEGIFNASMSRQRIAVEWGFGKVVNLFGLIDY
jgi:hypothetical protein